jgi:hypothetical protein
LIILKAEKLKFSSTLQQVFQDSLRTGRVVKEDTFNTTLVKLFRTSHSYDKRSNTIMQDRGIKSQPRIRIQMIPSLVDHFQQEDHRIRTIQKRRNLHRKRRGSTYSPSETILLLLLGIRSKFAPTINELQDNWNTPRRSFARNVNQSI